MTDMGLIRTEVSAGGVGAELFWFHDEGYFEEFLGHKSGFQSTLIFFSYHFFRFERSSNWNNNGG